MDVLLGIHSDGNVKKMTAVNVNNKDINGVIDMPVNTDEDITKIVAIILAALRGENNNGAPVSTILPQIQNAINIDTSKPLEEQNAIILKNLNIDDSYKIPKDVNILKLLSGFLKNGIPENISVKDPVLKEIISSMTQQTNKNQPQLTIGNGEPTGVSSGESTGGPTDVTTVDPTDVTTVDPTLSNVESNVVSEAEQKILADEAATGTKVETNVNKAAEQNQKRLADEAAVLKAEQQGPAAVTAERITQDDLKSDTQNKYSEEIRELKAAAAPTNTSGFIGGKTQKQGVRSIKRKHTIKKHTSKSTTLKHKNGGKRLLVSNKQSLKRKHGGYNSKSLLSFKSKPEPLRKRKTIKKMKKQPKKKTRSSLFW